MFPMHNGPASHGVDPLVLATKLQPPGWRRLRLATAYALAGLRSVWRREAAFRQEAIAALALAPLAMWMDASPLERAALIAALLFVLVIELLNSALEAVVDLVSPQHHPLAAVAKDAGAAAVMLALVAAAATWALVLWPGY